MHLNLKITKERKKKGVVGEHIEVLSLVVSLWQHDEEAKSSNDEMTIKDLFMSTSFLKSQRERKISVISTEK